MKKSQHVKSKIILLLTLLLSAFFVMQSNDVRASHFRGGSISWTQVSGNTVRFTVTSSWGSFVSNPFLNFGDGSPVSTVSHVQVSSGPGFVTYQGTIDHTYPHAGPWTVFWASNARIAALQNASNAPWRVETVVCLTGNTGSPVSSVPAIVQMVASGQSFQLPAADPDGDQLIWSWATTAQTGIPTIPPAGFTISPTGLLTLTGGVWSAGQQFALVTNITEGAGGCGAKTVADFIVQIQAASSNLPPTCVLNGNATNNINVGVPFSISFTGTDPEGLFLTANPSSLPPGATIGPLSGVSPLTTTFNYTPTQAQANQSFAITLTYVDAGNLTSLCSFSLTVGSGCPPSLQLSGTPSAPNCPGGSNGSINLSVGAGTAPFSYLWSNSATTQNISGLTAGAYSVTVTDANNCTDNASFNVPNGVDNTPPTITCPAAVSATTNTGCTATGVNLGTPATNDNCSVASVTNDAPAEFPLGATTVTWTVTDGSSNTATCTQIVTVTDNENPTITCPSDIILCGSQVVNYNMPTATDNCTVVITQTAGLPSGSVFPVGTTVNTFTATDPSGNSVSCSFDVTINPIPTVNAIASQTVCNNSATTAVNFTGSVPGTVFNWSNNTTSIGLAASGTGDIASFTALNPTNAPVTATITVTPEFTSGGLTCTGQSLSFTFRVNPTAILNPVANKVVCFGAAPGGTVFSSPTTGGPIVYTWTNNTPAIGLAASGTGNIPNFIAKNTTNAPLVATITVTPSFGTAGNCSGTPRTFTITVNPTPNFDNAQYFSGILSASDPVYARPEQYNQGGTCAISVDPTAGSAVHYRTHTFTLTEPSNVVVSLLNSDGGLVVPTGNNINIDPFLQLVGPGAFNPASSCTNSIAANDDAGFLPQGRLSRIATTTALAAGTYTVVVTTWENTPGVLPQTLNDLVLPWDYTLAVLTTSQTVCNNSATSALNFNTTVPGTVFNWTNNNTSIGLAANGSGSIPSFTAINTGLNPVTATITVTPSYTNAGLTCFGAPVRYNITVNPTPTITCPANQTVSNITGACSAVVNYNSTATGTPTPAISYTFNGVTSGSGSGNGSGSTFNVGVTTVTLTATNDCGAPSCSFTVTVVDDEAPTIICNAPIEISNDEGVCGAVVNYVVTSTDNCPGQLVTQTAGLLSGGVFPVGVTTNTFVVTDASGNTATCSFTVKVNDTENPTITCNAPIEVNNDLGVCGAAVTYTVTSTDNCPGQLVTQTAGLPSGSVFPVGVTTNSFLVTDASGNTATCSFTVTVTDNEKPVISVQNIARCFADDNFGCSINLGATATDNCAMLSLISNAPGCFPVGTTTVTWTATDIYGNVSTATQLVTRNPEININICAGPTRTIYTGTTSGVGPFGPQSVNLTSVVTGGTPGYSYKWTPSTGLNNALIANPVASPTVTTTYTLTVTDSKGCKRSLSITINVLPLSAAVCSGNGNNVKFSVCHIPPGNPSNAHNICISVNALNAHLTSGSNGHNNCYLGPCQQNCFSTIPGAASFISRTQTVEEEVIVLETPIVEVQQPDFRVNVYPNPTAYDFSIQVLSKSNEPITIRILDLNGKVISVGNTFLKGNNIKAGANLPGGTYIAEVTQGTNRKTIKLVKLN